MSLVQKLRKLRYFKWILRFIIVVVIVAVVWGIVAYKNKPLCPNCNVILVSLDTLSALHLPCYGYERNTAPNLCKFADENIFFVNSYSQSPITLDSHFSIFTSLYPHTHKMTKVLGGPLNENYKTLAQIFRGSGYETIYNGPLNDDHMPLNLGIERGFNIIQDRSKYKSIYDEVEYWDDSLSELAKNNEKNKPTFLFLHTYAVHEPYLLGKDKKFQFTDLISYPGVPLTQEEFNNLSPEFFSYIEKYILNKGVLVSESNIKLAEQIKKAKDIKEKRNLFESLSSRVRFISFYIYHLNNLDKKDKNQAAFIAALYDEAINDLDKKLAKLIKFITDPKLSKNTILIITADHGQEFMEHGHYYHANNLFATSTRVPLIFYIPGVTPKKIIEMVQGIDIYPTVLSLVGLKPKSPIEGIDLVGLIKGDKNAATNKYLLSEFRGIIGIQDENFRFYYNTNYKNPTGLYDLSLDPKEQKNLLTQDPKKVDELTKLIDTLHIPVQSSNN